MIGRAFHALASSSAARRFATGSSLSRAVSRRFVAGETVETAIEAAREANAAGLRVTCNYLGEAVTNRQDAAAAARVYEELAGRMAVERIDGSISVKLTQLGQDIGEDILRENVRRVVGAAERAGVFVRFDMESSAYTDRTLDFATGLWKSGVRNIGVVLQAYLLRTEEDALESAALGIPVRLCKGAYEEPGEVAYQKKKDVDESFERVMRILLDRGLRAAIATHDVEMIDATMWHAQEQGIPKSAFEFQMLYGVRRDVQTRLLSQGYRVRVYIPFGNAWYPYLMRRLAERPANVMFLVSSLWRESALGALVSRLRRNGRGAGPAP